MPLVSVPGVGRKIMIELHPPVGDGPTLADIASFEQMAPTAFVAWLASPGYKGAVGHVLTTIAVDEQTPWAKQRVLARMKNQAEAYYQALRRSSGKRGRPQTLHFTLAEDFAILVLYFKSRGFRQPRAKAREFWGALNFPVSERLVKAALRKVRAWRIPDLDAAARVACKANGLPDPPRDRAKRRRQ